MGFLDHTTNNIIVDAVLTDKGREKLASASGLNIRQYAFADTEVDYTLLKKYGEIVGKEKIEKNTPIYEANTAGSRAQTHTLLTDGTGNLVETITIGTGTISTNNQSTFPILFANFDPNVTITYYLIFSHNSWRPEGFTSTQLSGQIHQSSSQQITMDNNGQQEVSVTFDTVNNGTAPQLATFQVVQGNGLTSSVKSATISYQTQVPI